MKKTAIALAFACAAAFGGSAFAADPLTCSISCNKEYNQCMAAGIDWSLVTQPNEVGSRMSSNMSAARACREGAAACYSACNG